MWGQQEGPCETGKEELGKRWRENVLEKWQMSVALTKNQSGVPCQTLTLRIWRCALGWGGQEGGWKTLNRAGLKQGCKIRHFLVMPMS